MNEKISLVISIDRTITWHVIVHRGLKFQIIEIKNVKSDLKHDKLQIKVKLKKLNIKNYNMKVHLQMCLKLTQTN